MEVVFRNYETCLVGRNAMPVITVMVYQVSTFYPPLFMVAGSCTITKTKRTKGENLFQIFILQGHFKVWTTIIFGLQLFLLQPTPRAKTGLPLLQSIRM